jgi:hypothetical protein
MRPERSSPVPKRTPPSLAAALLAGGLLFLLAVPEAQADFFGGDIPLLGTLVSQGAQQLTNATQLLRTVNEEVATAKRLVAYTEEARGAFGRFQHYSVADFGDDAFGLSGGTLPVADARRLASGLSGWAPATGELQASFRRCVASESTGSSACRQLRSSISPADAEQALARTFGPALSPETQAADYEVARGLSAADTHQQQERARAVASASSRSQACGSAGDSTVCGLAQTARQESQLDTANEQLAEAVRLAAVRLALENAERKRALGEAHERRDVLLEGLKALETPALDVQADGVSLAGGD